MTEQPKVDAVDPDAVKQAVEEMSYQAVESQAGIENNISTPCQLRFTEKPEQDTERFHAALDEREYAKIDPDPDRLWTPNKPHYEGEIFSKAHHRRLRVIVFRGDVVRIFPYDGYIPTEGEFAKVIEAIQVGFDSPLEHDPIEEEP